MYFSPEETPLFRIKSSQGILFGSKIKYIMIGLIIVMMLLVLYGTLRHNGPLEILILFIPLLGASIVLLLKFPFKIEHGLCITNRKIYLYSRLYQNLTVNTGDFSSIKAISFIRSKFRRADEDTGRIEFVMQDYDTKLHSITNIQNLSRCQRIIESILYEYGNIEQRWENVQKKTNFKFPYNLTISPDVLSDILKRQKRLNFYLILATVINCLLFPLLYLLLGFLFGELEAWQVQIIQYGIIFGFILSLTGSLFILLLEKYKTKKNTSPINSKLSLNASQIEYSGEAFPIIIPMNEKICLGYKKIKEPFRKYPMNWMSDIDGLNIKSAYNSNIELIFGPLSNFPDLFEVFFCYFIMWKANQGFLFTKEQIADLEKIPFKEITEEREEIPSSEHISVQNIQEKQDASTINYTALFQSVQKYMDSDERIVLSHKPHVNLKQLYLKFVLSLMVFILGWALWILGNLTSNNLMMVGSMLMAIFSIPVIFCTCCTGDIFINKSFFIFTSKKIIWKYSKNYILVNYNNISSIIRREHKKTYDIELRFKKPLESSPFINKDILSIPKVLQGNTLIDQLNYLKEHLLS